MAEPRSDANSKSSLRPDSAQELSQIIGNAARDGQSLQIRGGGTHERFSNLAPDSDLIVDVTALDAVIEYSPVDLTLAVDTGVRIETIDRLLAEHNQRLALDAPNRATATIGGTFASGLSGPRRLRYGSLKDAVIGAEIISSKGDVAKTGGMVVKNVSGYEVARLHYGAHGAFGVVSRLNLKVLPAIESRVEIVFGCNDARDAVAIGSNALLSTLDAAAVYIWKPRNATWDLHVQFEGSDAYTSAQSQRAAAILAEGSSPISVDVARLGGQSTPAFDVVSDLIAEPNAVARLSVPASRQLDLLQKFGDVEEFDILADLGSGLVYARGDARSSLHERLIDLNVATAYMSLPDTLKRGLDVFGPMDENGAAVVRRLKDEFDPRRMFNPGRFALFL